MRTVHLVRGMLANPADFVRRRFETYGDFYHVDEGRGSHLYVSRDPEVLEQVLVTNASSFRKQGGAVDRLRTVLGNGLLISDGELWRRQRRIMQPVFHLRMLQDQVAHVGRHVQALSWSDGDLIDASESMLQLTLRIVCQTLFDHEVSQETDSVASTMEAVSLALAQGSWMPSWLPTPGTLRTRRSIRDIDRLIAKMVSHRRASDDERTDLLSLLLDVEGGMSETQLRDELVTLFLAGHETTAHALAWAWLMIAENPCAAERMYAELDEVLEGRVPTLEDLPRLIWTNAVVDEALRLYPPAYVVPRVATEDVEIKGHSISAGSQFALWIYHLQRHPKHFEDPEAFRPERHLEPGPDRRIYLPFGRGARKCIGIGLALMEMRVILASIAQRYRLERVESEPVEAQFGVTISPRGGLPMKVRERMPSRPARLGQRSPQKETA